VVCQGRLLVTSLHRIDGKEKGGDIMVTLYQVWQSIQDSLAHFGSFIFGYALAKLGIAKTGGLFALFILGNWLWHNWSSISHLLTAKGG
jgi:hypothetical protein